MIGKWRDHEHVLQQVQFSALNPDVDELSDVHYGIVCNVTLSRRKFTIPLDRLENIQGKANRRLLKDYCYWLHNYY